MGLSFTAKQCAECGEYTKSYYIEDGAVVCKPCMADIEYYGGYYDDDDY